MARTKTPTTSRISAQLNGDTEAPADEAKAFQQHLTIAPLKFGHLIIVIKGVAPYMQARFSQKAMRQMEEKHRAGSQAKKGKQREARDFDDDYEQAKHVMDDGRIGIPAGCFRAAMISACKLVGFHMTVAKLSVFVEHDGLDRVDRTPLIEIKGAPEKSMMPVRNATGVADLRCRPMWKEWSATLRLNFDMGQFAVADVLNLLVRAGRQVGIGEGRPDSKKSNGLGFGLFDIESVEGQEERTVCGDILQKVTATK